MNFAGWGLWGFVGTVVLTLGMAASQHFGLTRMSLPYLLGTMVTPNRDRAKMLGLLIHFLDGWLFSLLYAAAFESWQTAGWARGMGIGLVHALFVLTVLLPSLPGLHPRMASSSSGPEVTEQLESPGFWGLNYGLQTPIVVLAAHLAFGAILGAFYHPSRG